MSHNRGLGWNTTNTCRPEADSSVAVSEAYASEANVKVVPRSEYFDRDLTKQEHAQDVQTLLVRVAEKKMATTTTMMTTTTTIITSTTRTSGGVPVVAVVRPGAGVAPWPVLLLPLTSRRVGLPPNM